MNKLKSELAYLIALAVIIGLGFAKAYIPTFPYGAAMGTLVPLTLGIFGKRLAQKQKRFSNHED